MSNQPNGFVRAILLFFRMILTTVFTLAVFALLLGFVAFRCMHTTGSHMLASMLSSYPVVNIIPKLYYAPSTLERIIAEQDLATLADDAAAGSASVGQPAADAGDLKDDASTEP